jgi:DNA modification methylase
MFDDAPAALGVEGTFRPNHEVHVHRWYPYLEGFSHSFVTALLDEFGPKKGPLTLYEPFAGSGTTPTVAAFRGDDCYYSEINPFMRLVIEAKTNAVRRAFRHKALLQGYFTEIVARSRAEQPSASQAADLFRDAFCERPYFTERRLIEVLSLRQAIKDVPAPDDSFVDLANLALGSIAVGSSELRRAGDLRYRTPNERLPASYSPIEAFTEQCSLMAHDMLRTTPPLGMVELVTPSALDPIPMSDFADVVITSPPYLNGTNYIRNAKLELWLTGFLNSESELTGFRKQAVTAGICDVVKNGRDLTSFDFVEEVAKKLDEVTYDRRIPLMVRRYFSDTALWLGNIRTALKPGGRAVVDIGDSRFAGVHVPTDKCMAAVGEAVGLKVYEERFVRARKSKDGTELKQVLLIFEKAGTQPSHSGRDNSLQTYRRAAQNFCQTLPHKQEPYSSRNWGHNLHSLCSYLGKLKPAIAHFLVHEFTGHGDRVLDPLSGAGAIPLEACLQGRQAVANDIQELAFLLSSAKIKVCDPAAVWREYEKLGRVIESGEPDESDLSFGFNGTIADFFHERTLQEVLRVRRYVRDSLAEGLPNERAFVLSCFTHLLHGNRPYALSRRSHPVTPLKPQGEFEYRPAMPRLREKIQRALESEPPQRATLDGEAHFGDFRALKLDEPVDAVITSPPFHDSTRFYVANWMRLWLSGWEREDFDRRKESFLETQQKRSMDVYVSFLDKCAEWLKPQGKLIMHLGRVKGFDMSAEIQARLTPDFELVYAADESVAGAEKFGLSDQGATDSHQYLFLAKRGSGA